MAAQLASSPVLAQLPSAAVVRATVRRVPLLASVTRDTGFQLVLLCMLGNLRHRLNDYLCFSLVPYCLLVRS